MTGGSRFNRHSDALRARFGERVWRIGIDGGFSCPNRADGRGSGGCAYCSPRAARAPYSPEGGASVAAIEAQVEAALAFLRRRYDARLFFVYFQAFSSTYAPVDDLARRYEAALQAAKRSADVRGLVVSTRPDCIDAERAALLASYAGRGLEVWAELGLQSANDASLARIGRGHGFADFIRARALLAEAGIRTAVHLILGLPGEARPDMLATIRRVAALGLDGVKFHDLYIARGSRFASEYLAGELALLHSARLPPLLADCLELLPPSCEIMRLCSDSLPEERLAPRRPTDKARLYREVEELLAGRGSRQGSRFAARDR